jgi:predicted nucleic acid-binding protein
MTANGSTMADVVLDANVLVGWLDDHDGLASRSADVLRRLRADGSRAILLDICVGEAISVICRRSRERKSDPPDLAMALARIRGAAERGEIRFVAKESQRLLPDLLGIVEASGGVLNFNDALLVALQRADVIGDVASFDQGLDAAPGFRRIS